MCYPCHRTLPQLPQFSILMNLYFVYVINIRFICDDEIYLLTYLLTSQARSLLKPRVIFPVQIEKTVILLRLYVNNWNHAVFTKLNDQKLLEKLTEFCLDTQRWSYDCCKYQRSRILWQWLTAKSLNYCWKALYLKIIVVVLSMPLILAVMIHLIIWWLTCQCLIFPIFLFNEIPNISFITS